MKIEKGPDNVKVLLVDWLEELFELPEEERQSIDVIIFDEKPYRRIPRDLSYLFANFTSLTQILGLEIIDTHKVRSFSHCFANCYNLRYADVSQFNTHNCRDFSSMFRNCKRLCNLNLDHFSAKCAMSIDNMFRNCTFLQTISLWRFDLNDGVSAKNVFTGCTELRHIAALPRMYELYQQQAQESVT